MGCVSLIVNMTWLELNRIICANAYEIVVVLMMDSNAEKDLDITSTFYLSTLVLGKSDNSLLNLYTHRFNHRLKMKTLQCTALFRKLPTT